MTQPLKVTEVGGVYWTPDRITDYVNKQIFRQSRKEPGKKQFYVKLLADMPTVLISSALHFYTTEWNGWDVKFHQSKVRKGEESRIIAVTLRIGEKGRALIRKEKRRNMRLAAVNS